MAIAAAADASFIDDVAFLDELDRCDPIVGQTAASGFDPRIDVDALEALEHGLSTNPHARQPGISARPPSEGRPAYPACEPIAPLDEPLVEATPPTDRTLRFMVAALVLMAVVTAGSVTAAFVFHGRLVQITASRPASR